MDTSHLAELLQRFRRGDLDVHEALEELQSLPYVPLGFATVDTHRSLRQGIPEVIFCEGKTPEQIAAIAGAILEGNDRLLATRASVEAFEAIKALEPRAAYHPLARAVTVRRRKIAPTRGVVLVACAGTSDLPVAEEAAITAELFGSRVDRLFDVGVAGLHRLLDHGATLRAARVLVIVAGMDGVLPSVVGGLVAKPLIAVPTSVGYGASFRGLAALLTMLNSCAAGVAVVNIDNGFGAGVLAHRINLLGERGRGQGAGGRKASRGTR